MQFPNYPTTEYRPSTNLVKGYLTYLGENEPDHRQELDKHSRRHLRSIAVRIGRGCIAAVNNNAKAAQRIFRRARKDAEPAVVPARRATRIGRTAIQLHHIADMLDQHDNLEATEKIRQTMHTETVNDVKYLHRFLVWSSALAHSPPPAKLGEVKGELAQKVALGLITRYAHPWIMATPSLLHHDNGTVRSFNYDMLVAESMPNNWETQSYKVQVKSACAGLCCDRPERRTPQKQYNEDIAIVSACCDLQRGDDRDVNLVNFRAADLLVKEHDGTATTDEIHELDAFSDSLILSITMGDERRMGLIPLAA